MKAKKSAALRAVPAPKAEPEMSPNRAAVLRLFGIEERTKDERTTPELLGRYFAPFEALPFALEEALAHEAFAVQLIGAAREEECFAESPEFRNFVDRTARRIETLSQLISRTKSEADKSRGAR